MKKGSLVIAAMSLAILAGCSTNSGDYAEANVSTLISAVPLIKGQSDKVVSTGPKSGAVGGEFPLAGQIRVRTCSADMTACKVGVGKIDTVVTVLALSKEKATVKVDLQMKLDKTTTSGTSGMNSSVTLDDDLPILHSNYSKSGTVSVEYNRIGRFDLPYGAALKLCIEAPLNGSTDAAVGCQGPEIPYPL